MKKTFQEQFNEALKKQGVTVKDLSAATGISLPTLYSYSKGTTKPSDDRRRAICEALDLPLPPRLRKRTAAPEPAVRRMKTKEAAALLGLSDQTVRVGLQQGVFPWGYAIKTGQSRWTYFISAEKFAQTEGIEIT